MNTQNQVATTSKIKKIEIVSQSQDQGKRKSQEKIPVHLTEKDCNSVGSRIEKDQQFLSDLFSIVEKHHRTSQNQRAAPIENQNLSDETCEQIHNIARRHGAAKRFNIYSEADNKEIPQEHMCKCGCGRAEGEPLPFCSNEVEQFFFGPAIILFFFLLRKISLLVLSGIFMYGVFSLVTNIDQSPELSELSEMCRDNPGTLSFFCEYKYASSVRYKSSNLKLMHIQVWLGFIFCIFWIFGLRIIRNLGRHLNKKVDEKLETSSDYVIQISNLPYGDYCEKELLNYICHLWKTYRGDEAEVFEIKSVQIVYSMERPRMMINEIVDTALKLASNLQKVAKIEEEEEEADDDGENKREETSEQLMEYSIECEKWKEYSRLKNEFIIKLEEIEEYRRSFSEDEAFRKEMATDMAFIEFKDPDTQTEFLREIRQYRTTILGEIKEYLSNKLFPNKESLLFKGSNIRITRAPEPSDIHWQNCEKKFSYKRVFLVWFLTFVIVGISFGMLMLIRFLRASFKPLNSLSILISISLQIFNRIIWNCLVSFVDLEENNTKTDNIISIMTKSAFAIAVNVTAIPMITNLVLKDNLYGPEGLIGISFDFQFTVFFMMINLNVINFPYQLKRIGLCIPLIRNYIIRNNAHIIGQFDSAEDIKSVLDYYEPPPFPVAAAYVYITTIIYQAVFFCHVQPSLLFYLLLNLAVFYLVLKYLLIRRCRIPELFDFLIFETSITILQYVPLLYGVGSLIFIQIIGEGNEERYSQLNPVSIPSILTLFFWLIAMLNPKRIISNITSCLMPIFIIEEPKRKRNRIISKEGIANKKNYRESIQEIIQNNKAISKRRQCYYLKCGLNDLLNYESKLVETNKSESAFGENRTKIFCERFSIDSQFNFVEDVNELFSLMLNMKKMRIIKGNKKKKSKEKKYASKVLTKITEKNESVSGSEEDATSKSKDDEKGDTKMDMKLKVNPISNFLQACNKDKEHQPHESSSIAFNYEGKSTM